MTEFAVITSASVEAFLDRLASADPTPGGGSAAAIMGAMGAALIAMVCRVSLGKKGVDANAEQALTSLCEESDRLRSALTAMVAEDVAVFEALMLAYRLPKATEQDRAGRSAEIQRRLRVATEVPLNCARASAEVIHLARRAAELGSTSVVSDAGVGSLAAYAALRSAALNVHINVPNLHDKIFAAAALNEIETLSESCGLTDKAVYAVVRSRVAG